MDTGYVVVHGFGGSPENVKGIVTELVSRGISIDNIYTPLLKGHNNNKRNWIKVGTRYSEMVDDLKQIIIDVKDNHERVVVIGYSMGALICMAVAMDIQVDKLVLLNGPIYIWDFKSFFTTLRKNIGNRRAFHAKKVLSSFRYNKVRNNMELTRLRKYIFKNLNKVTCDTFIVQSKYDYVAKPTSGKIIYDNIGSLNKRISYYDTTTHFIPSETDVTKVTCDILKWIGEQNDNEKKI